MRYYVMYDSVMLFMNRHLFLIIVAMMFIVMIVSIICRPRIERWQALSDRRLDNYLLFKELYDGFGGSMHLLDNSIRNNVMKTYAYVFDHFLNTPYWYGYGSVFDGNETVRPMFIDGLQRLQGKSTEADLLFLDKRIAEFYDRYVRFLRTAYEYTAVADYENSETIYRQKVFDSFDSLVKLYNDIQNMPIAKVDLRFV